MPTAERLADDGLRYSRFHVTPLCSPTRQALMTGRNHHSVGMGVTSEMSTPEPGYHGYRPASAGDDRPDPRRQRLLHGCGRQVAPDPAGRGQPVGPLPALADGGGLRLLLRLHGRRDEPLVPAALPGPLRRRARPAPRGRLPPVRGPHRATPSPGSRTSRRSPRTARSSPTSRFGATHAPFHVAPEWRDKYAGTVRRTAGTRSARPRWPARRSSASCRRAPSSRRGPRASRTGTSSTTPRRGSPRGSWRPTPASPSTPTSQVGRLVDALEEMGVLDDTLIFYLLGDNGASGEGGPRGTFREHLVGHGIQDDTADMAARLDTLGDATTYAIYPVGWALAMNTPYPWTKQLAHLGGTRDGMIVRWGNGIEARGEIRHQWHHVIDVLPTILEAAGVAGTGGLRRGRAAADRGHQPAYTFDDADAPERHSTQYFEMIGNRGVYHEGWTAVTRHGIPWEMVGDGRPPFEDDVWELYDHTERLEPGARPRGRAPGEAARAAGALPARGRELPRAAARRPGHRAREPRRRRPARPAPRPLVAVVRSAGRAAHRGGGAQRQEPLPRRSPPTSRSSPATSGVVVAQGGRFGGWSLYLVDGRAALRLQLRRSRPRPWCAAASR